MWKDYLFVFGVLIVLYMAYGELRKVRNIKEGFTGSPVVSGDIPDEGSVHFLPADAVAGFLERDEDEFIRNLSPLDLYARRSKSNAEYLARAVASATNFTSEQQDILTVATKKADEFFANMEEAYGVNGDKAVRIPWIFAMTNGKMYEDGLPHTRANIIFFSTEQPFHESSLVRTLVHEKVHVYQRLHSEDIQDYLVDAGYKRWKRRRGSAPRLRANPDLDEWIYIHPESKETMARYYSGDTPASITDVVDSVEPDKEHPYEEAAYRIAEKVNVKDKVL